MPSEQLNQFLKSGKTLITDTKLKGAIKPKERAKPEELGDPHKVFVRRTIQEKPKKSDIIEEFKKFIVIEEAKL